MKPRRRICDQSDTLLAASAAELVPNVLGFLFFGAYQQCREGDPDAWATQVLHIICPGLQEVVHEFVYLGSTITDNLSIDSELNYMHTKRKG